MSEWTRVENGHYTRSVNGLKHEIVKCRNYWRIIFDPQVPEQQRISKHMVFNSLRMARDTFANWQSKRTKTVVNLQSGREVEIAEDTPLCCDPSSETYWSM